MKIKGVKHKSQECVACNVTSKELEPVNEDTEVYHDKLLIRVDQVTSEIREL